MNIFEYKDFFKPFFDSFESIYTFNFSDVIDDTISFSDLKPLTDDQFKEDFLSFIEKNSFQINLENLNDFFSHYQENTYHIFPGSLEQCMSIDCFENDWFKFYYLDELIEIYQECYKRYQQYYLSIQLKDF